jgi:predicted lipid-binding transport protein (Tim44 family)
MRRKSWLVAVLVALTLALTPAIADARAGGGSSIGSRGSNTFSAPPSTSSGSAMPFQRSMTQPSAPTFATPGLGQPAYQRSGSPFMSGLFGGLIGAGIGGLLFGHGMFGGIGSFGGFLGFLIQIALVVMVVRFLWRRFMRPQPALAGLGAMPRTGMQQPMGGGMGGAAPGGKQRLAIAPQDFQTYEQLLRNIQAAWTAHDLSALGRLVTPEMLSYFSEQLADQTSRGVRNSVTDVRLEKGDLSESWSERGHDYATVSMRFSMLDVTRDAMGRVVDGDAATRTIATEFWTFMRANGGVWVLSAIQQAR